MTMKPYVQETTMKPMSKAKFLSVALTAVVLLAFGAIWAFNAFMGKRPYSGSWEPKRPHAEIEAACQAYVNVAETKAREAIQRRSQEFSDFIDSRKPGAKPFSKDIVSLYGKWRAMSPYIPFTDKDGHKKYVVEKFDQHLFNAQDLAAAIKRSIEGVVKDIEQAENELAVALRQEILGRSLAPDEIPVAAEEFKKAVTRLVTASQWDAAKTAGNLVVSEVVAQVATPVLIRMGVSAGILATGAANAWWSVGGAFVIGILVDVIWEWIDDPAGDIERTMVFALDDLAIKGAGAISDEMVKILDARQKLWSNGVQQLLL
jgi:hypothetical protein